MKNGQDQFNILRKLDKKLDKIMSQRELATDLGFSLGKLNYLINELKKEGLIKIKRFKRNNRKIGYVYILTPEGISKRTKMAFSFMKRKLIEYEELKREISNFKKDN